MTLAAAGKVVGGDPYELRIVLPDKNWSAETVEISGSGVAPVTQDGELVRATIQSANSGEVSWAVRFK